MLYFADDTKETKIEKISKSIEYVQCVLKNEMEIWVRKEYEAVLSDYRLELLNVME